MIDSDERNKLIEALYTRDDKKALDILNTMSQNTVYSGLQSLAMSEVINDAAQMLSSEDQELFKQFQQSTNRQLLRNLNGIHQIVSTRFIFDKMRKEIEIGSINIFDIILQTASQKIAEDITTAGFHGVLGFLLRGGLTIMITSSMPLFLPWSHLITWLGQVGYKSYRQLQQESIANTTYEVCTKETGKIIARNLNSRTLEDFPIFLPERREISADGLFASGSNLQNPPFQDADPYSISSLLKKIKGGKL